MLCIAAHNMLQVAAMAAHSMLSGFLQHIKGSLSHSTCTAALALLRE